jgi:DNA-binding NtrC family response regulator
LEKYRILVLDDDQDVAETYASMLEDEGFFTLAVITVGQAFVELSTSSFDAIVSDLMMPHMNGQHFLAELNQMGSRVPVIFISGKGTPEIFNEAWRAGAFDVLEKPFDNQRFISIVTSAAKFGRGYHDLQKAQRTEIELLINTGKWEHFKVHCSNNNILPDSLLEKVVDFYLAKK